MEHEGSLPHSYVPATYPYPEPARSSQYTHIPLPEYPSSYYHPIYPLRLPVGFFSIRFPTKNLYMPLLSPTGATRKANFILLDFITRTILDVECRSLSSSLCSFLHSLFTSTFYSQAPSAYVPPSMRVTIFLTHTKQHSKL